MKHIALILLAATSIATAADNKSWADGLSLSTVGVYKQAEFTHGPGTYGAGVDLGLPVNKFVSIHVRNLAFENPDQWGGSAIDETAVYGRADFVKLAKERFRLFGTGGGSRHWDSEDWSFHLGLGAEYRFTKNVAVSASRELRAYFTDRDKDWLTALALTWRF